MKRFKIAVMMSAAVLLFFLAPSAANATATPASSTWSSYTILTAAHTTVTDTSRDTVNYNVAAFKRKWDKKIKKLNSQINKEQKKVKKVSADKRQKLDQQINELKMKRDELQQEVNAAGNKSADQWDEFKKDVNRKYQDLSMKVKDFFKTD